MNKQFYQSPSIEVVNIELEGAILSGSGLEGASNGGSF